jgi:hypothetical protein
MSDFHNQYAALFASCYLIANNVRLLLELSVASE